MSAPDDPDDGNWKLLGAQGVFTRIKAATAKRRRMGGAFADADRQVAVIRRFVQVDAEKTKDTTLLRALWSLSAACESPLEDLMLHQLATAMWPEFVAWDTVLTRRIDRRAGAKLAIAPQQQFGKYRVDFLLKPGRHHPGLVIECDGEEFHDEARDGPRDAYLGQVFGLSVLRVPGYAIMGSSAGIDLIAEIIRHIGPRTWMPPAGRLKVNWPERARGVPRFFERERLRRGWRTR